MAFECLPFRYPQCLYCILADCPHVRVYLSPRPPGDVRHETVSFLQFGFLHRLHALPA